MIKVFSKENVVVLSFNIGLGKNNSYPFKFEIGDKQEYDGLAELLANHIRSELSKTCEEIREQAYKQGWKDAKGKKKKATYFSCVLGKTSKAGF
jgi:hypothetical protein